MKISSEHILLAVGAAALVAGAAYVIVSDEKKSKKSSSSSASSASSQSASQSASQCPVVVETPIGDVDKCSGAGEISYLESVASKQWAQNQVVVSGPASTAPAKHAESASGVDYAAVAAAAAQVDESSIAAGALDTIDFINNETNARFTTLYTSKSCDPQSDGGCTNGVIGVNLFENQRACSVTPGEMDSRFYHAATY